MPGPALTRRLLGVADTDNVLAVLAASDLAVVGFVDVTRDDVAADLRRPDLEAHGWYDGAGRLVGYACASRTEDSNQVEVDAYVHPEHDPELGHELLEFLEDRAKVLVAEVGCHRDPWLGLGVYRQDLRSQDWVRRAGYEPRTTFTRMRIDLDSYPGAPPTAIEVRPVHAEAGLRVAHAIEDESFVDHYGHVPLSYESWLARLTEQGPDHARVWLADLDGRAVGASVTTRAFEDSDDAAYVRTLGVRPAGRGRGVAKALLHDCFTRARAAGRTAVLLHVDVANVTGALRLYESVGMRAVLEIDAWAKGSPTPKDCADTPL